MFDLDLDLEREPIVRSETESKGERPRGRGHRELLVPLRLVTCRGWHERERGGVGEAIPRRGRYGGAGSAQVPRGNTRRGGGGHGLG
jgi:hypothetical protein